MDEYTKQLTDNELKALSIAKDHLQTSFSLKKSIGFITFNEKKNND